MECNTTFDIEFHPVNSPNKEKLSLSTTRRRFLVKSSLYEKSVDIKYSPQLHQQFYFKHFSTLLFDLWNKIQEKFHLIVCSTITFVKMELYEQ